jgi:hypothetical protein
MLTDTMVYALAGLVAIGLLWMTFDRQIRRGFRRLRRRFERTRD